MIDPQRNRLLTERSSNATPTSSATLQYRLSGQSDAKLAAVSTGTCIFCARPSRPSYRGDRLCRSILTKQSSCGSTPVGISERTVACLFGQSEAASYASVQRPILVLGRSPTGQIGKRGCRRSGDSFKPASCQNRCAIGPRKDCVRRYQERHAALRSEQLVPEATNKVSVVHYASREGDLPFGRK